MLIDVLEFQNPIETQKTNEDGNVRQIKDPAMISSDIPSHQTSGRHDMKISDLHATDSNRDTNGDLGG